MQGAFDFGTGGEVARIRDALAAAFGRARYFPRRTPIGQLVKSLISSRTRDEVSLVVYERLTSTYSRWDELAVADVEDIQTALAAVKFPEVKAPHLQAALQRIASERPDFDLAFLGEGPVETALSWLERLPGVGRKVAASVLNFSTLDRPAFVADTHVLRVLRRYGLVAPKAQIEAVYQAVMQATPGWSGLDLAELHALLKGLGQTVCGHKRGACDRCPISQGCRTAGMPAAVST
jgi:endonuclease-3